MTNPIFTSPPGFNQKNPRFAICVEKKYVLPLLIRTPLYKAVCNKCTSVYLVDKSNLEEGHGCDGRAAFSGWVVGAMYHEQKCPCGGYLQVPTPRLRPLPVEKQAFLVKYHSESEWKLLDKLEEGVTYNDVTEKR